MVPVKIAKIYGAQLILDLQNFNKMFIYLENNYLTKIRCCIMRLLSIFTSTHANKKL